MKSYKEYKVTEDGIEYKVKEWNDEYKEWFFDGKLHRENGPAIEYPSGTKCWWLNGKLHRINGAAIEYSDGTKCWWLNGIEYTKKEYHLELLKRNLITEKQAFIELI